VWRLVTKKQKKKKKTKQNKKPTGTPKAGTKFILWFDGEIRVAICPEPAAEKQKRDRS